ncbi:uncharacterized protein FTJAE_10783 [Fusarium tjaetaba]|uniref:Uncharacterized protein n=1 Tax=Fusarium tjaetaba TaxID=1567544 RepID=A0A8H5VJ17_9HYPO|nr:uncharacterized protein FTJAE_10783 [Fusarium tjaetaba]KAF5622804.1 hypothetical protein FTJAE_10783 [Fusarium tjaetaba]
MDESHPPPGESSLGVGLPVTPQSQHTQAEVGDGSQLLPIDLVNDSASTPSQAQVPPIRRGRGRPRGSKNKKTLAAENAPRLPQRRYPSPALALGDERDNHQSWMGDEYIPSDHGGSPYRAIDRPQLGHGNDLASPDPYESQAVADFIKSYRNSVHLATERNRQSATISRERMREEEQYELAKLIDSHTWSQAQEDELDASWESGLVKAAILRLPDRGTCLSSVFETSFHLCNMDPLSLLSLYHNFEPEELLEEYKWVWMKLERSKLCNAAVNLPAAHSDMLYRRDDRLEVPAYNVFLPNNSVLGGFPRNPQPRGHFKAEGSPIRRSFNPDAGDLTQNIAHHKDQLNPFQAFLTQPDRAQGNLQNPFAKQPDPSPAQDPQIGGSEDGEITPIKLSDEEMMEEQLEHVPDVPEAAGGHSRKRDQVRYQDRQRKFKTKKQRQRRRGGYGRSRSYAPQGQGGKNWAAGGGSGYGRG